MAEETFRYVEFDPEKVWQEMHETYIMSGGDVLYPGDEKEILLRGALAMAIAVMAKVDTALRMDTLTYATGDYLKLYGEKRNCFYREAEAATAKVKITFQASGVSRTIPSGAELTADGAVIYQLGSDVEQTGSAQETTVSIVCGQTGTVGNGLHAGAQMQFVEPNDAVVSVLVTESASGGMDAEDEEAYRERIRRYGLSSVTTGPSGRYEAEAMEASTDVLDARALNDGDGEVGVYLVLKDTANESAVLSTVMSVLSAVDVRPLTDEVAVYVADEMEYTLNVRVWYSAFSGLSQSVQDTVDEYIAWQDQTVGRAFNPDKLVSMLYQTGVERVKFLTGSGMEVEEELVLEYTEIPPRARCKGTITTDVVIT